MVQEKPPGVSHADLEPARIKKINKAPMVAKGRNLDMGEVLKHPLCPLP